MQWYYMPIPAIHGEFIWFNIFYTHHHSLVLASKYLFKQKLTEHMADVVSFDLLVFGHKPKLDTLY